MPRFISKNGKHAVETAVATEAAELRRDGYTEEKAEAPKADAAKSTK
ncbi:hypothetical protein [Arthrobacter sp. MA-N2]|nr:hypothetical protein [Arthrobacter sp. MA-N2]